MNVKGKKNISNFRNISRLVYYFFFIENVIVPNTTWNHLKGYVSLKFNRKLVFVFEQENKQNI